MPSREPSFLPGQCVGNYRLVRLLGEGSMGLVFEATHTTIGGRAAVKVLRREMAMRPGVTQRFLTEAKAANRISHPSVVRVFDFGQTPEGLLYLAMEFVDGETLRDREVNRGRLPQQEALNIARQMAAGLSAAHAVGIVHRDLKPENIMLVSDPEAATGERIKLLDFGVARLVEPGGGPSNTRTNTLLGTPTYMSPEQCKNAKSVTGESDVYSLGAMLFQMLAGRPPFVASNAGDIIAMQLYDAPPKLRELVPEVAPELSFLIEHMLVKDLTERPSMERVEQALRDFSLTPELTSYPPARTTATRLNAAPTEGMALLSPQKTLHLQQGAPQTTLRPGAFFEKVPTLVRRNGLLPQYWPWLVPGVLLAMGIGWLIFLLVH